MIDLSTAGLANTAAMQGMRETGGCHITAARPQLPDKRARSAKRQERRYNRGRESRLLETGSGGRPSVCKEACVEVKSVYTDTCMFFFEINLSGR